MNRNSSIALFSAVFAVSIGLMGANGVFSMPSGITTSDTNYHESGGNLLGHVTLVAQDPSGNIKAYRQMDNVVTNVGRTCTAASLFGINPTSGTAGCAPRGSFNVIGIGSGAVTETTADTGLTTPISANPPQLRTVYTITNSTNAPTVGGVAVMTTSYLFGSSLTVAEADLQDATATAVASQHTFAHKQISPSISVNSGDTLTVTWTITTG